MNRYRSNRLNRLLDGRFKKITKDYIEREDGINGLNTEIYSVFKNTFALENKDTKIDPTESRGHDIKMDKELEKLLEKHEDFLRALDDE